MAHTAHCILSHCQHPDKVSWVSVPSDLFLALLEGSGLVAHDYRPQQAILPGYHLASRWIQPMGGTGGRLVRTTKEGPGCFYASGDFSQSSCIFSLAPDHTGQACLSFRFYWLTQNAAFSLSFPPGPEK